MLDLGRTFLQSVERSPNAVAIIDGDLRLTYAEWLEQILRVAQGLASQGLKHGDHLLVVLQNRQEFATLHWACQFLGVVVTPMNWRAKPEEIDYCLSDSSAKAVVFEEVSAQAVIESQAAQGVLRIGVDVSASVGPAADISYSELLASSVWAAGPMANADDFSLMLYTSGTTGKPKGVPRRHRHERAAALGHVAQNLYGVGERSLGVMPLYHTMGVRSLLSMALVDGRFICLPRFDSAVALQIIERERISNLYLVPTLYHDMLAHPSFASTNISSVRKLGFAGAPMHDALLLRLEEAFQPDLFVNHYGSSEVYTVAFNPDARKNPGSAGRSGINTRLRLVRLDASNPDELVPRGSEGQIIADLASEEAFEGYWNRPDANAKSLRGGWYFTGDTGYLDEDGELHVTGRVDDMIISGGENISPVDIESVLSLHPGVDEVAVAGLPDERWGQRVVAFVKRKNTVDSESLDSYCRATDLANFKRPREYVFVSEIPKSPVGKVLRRKLTAGEYQRDESGDQKHH
ncbi:UNVERIFIED_CONTAM: AMP-binding protein [Comamonas sp. A-3]|nr:AMP-binding protein [Comamonas thiooxydans]